MNGLGELIKFSRESWGLSLRKFSKRCALSHSYIKNLEDGDPRTGKSIMPTIDSLEKIAPALEMSLEELLKKVGYITEKGEGFEPSNLKLIRNARTYADVCKDIAAETGSKISPAIYESIETGKNINLSLIFIDTLAKFAGVDRSFFFKTNDEVSYKEATEKKPYLYSGNDSDMPSHIEDVEMLHFINNPESEEYLKLAKELFDKKISVVFLRSTVFKE